MKCPGCGSLKTRKNGKKVQNYSYRQCYRNFNERIGTPMYRMRTSPEIVEYAINNRTEGTGLRGTGRIYKTSHSKIILWEKRLAEKKEKWSPPVSEGIETTVEGDELYTRVGENLPPLTIPRMDN